MIRTFAAAGGLSLVGLAPLAAPGAAAAQTYGQPVYVSPSGRAVGGSPLSEVETRSYLETGRWADGYTGAVYVHVPTPGPYSYGYRAYGAGYGHDRYGYGESRRPAPSQGYRDVWGYNDDRPPSARGWSGERVERRHPRDCGCGDVYLYDR